jgi:hypothetical protein
MGIDVRAYFQVGVGGRIGLRVRFLANDLMTFSQTNVPWQPEV